MKVSKRKLLIPEQTPELKWWTMYGQSMNLMRKRRNCLRFKKEIGFIIKWMVWLDLMTQNFRRTLGEMMLLTLLQTWKFKIAEEQFLLQNGIGLRKVISTVKKEDHNLIKKQGNLIKCQWAQVKNNSFWQLSTERKL